MLPGAVLTRVAASHIRVGTFQYFAARGDTDGVRRLADHVIARHYPRSRAAPTAPITRCSKRVIARQADLVARWLLVGFIHGVMNTDNTSISGETIDYGPCAFMDDYDPADRVLARSTSMGRYAYANQPRIALWNLTRLAECLLPLFSDDQDKAIEQAQSALGEFAEKFSAAYQAGLRAQDRPVHGRTTATRRWCRTCSTRWRRTRPTSPSPSAASAMPRSDADMTSRARHCSPIPPPSTNGRRAGGSASPTEPQSAAERRDAMRAVNPAFIPRNHRVEAVIQAAVNSDDYAPFEELDGGAGEALRGPAGLRRLCRAAAAGAARAADVLRDVRRR